MTPAAIYRKLNAQQTLIYKQDHNEGQSISMTYQTTKRCIDIVLSLTALLISFIPGLFIMTLISLESHGSPIYSQVRVGKGGELFRCYKLRSMVADADNVEKYFTPEQLEIWRREHKVDNDPRITKIGKFIRLTSLDEIPQFINVLLGQMSVVGPRAITPEELHHFEPDVELLTSVPAGITGLWQIGERNNATFENGKRQQIELDYVRIASTATDIKIMLETFSTMFIKRSGK